MEKILCIRVKIKRTGYQLIASFVFLLLDGDCEISNVTMCNNIRVRESLVLYESNYYIFSGSL